MEQWQQELHRDWKKNPIFSSCENEDILKYIIISQERKKKVLMKN
jgi:hypothetical protein